MFAFVDVIFSLQMSKFCQVYLVLSVIRYIRKHNQVIYILKISKFYLSLLLVFYLMHPSSVLCAKLLQSCPTFCDTMDCSLPASSVHGTLQARILDWVAIPFSRGSSWSRYWTQLSCTVDSFPAEPPGKPLGGSDGSVVKALDLKSNEVSLCRFKPCLLGKWLALGFPGVCACKEWDTTEQWTHSLSNQLYSHKK